MTAIWAAVAIAGLGVAIVASRFAVTSAARVAGALGVPPFLIGITLLAIGTDLPEIANSIIASMAGHGDVNVGDSIGSAATQVTLVLGLLPWLVGRFTVSRREVLVVGGMTTGALLLGAVVLHDGLLSRTDGLALVSLWGVLTWAAARLLPPPEQLELQFQERSLAVELALAAVGLLAVGAGAVVAVEGFVRVAEALAVPEYLLSFFVLALGTSLPELVVTVAAVRRGERELAIGDALGSSLLDASVSLGAGPLIAPTVVTAATAVRGSLLTAAAVAAVVAVLTITGRHNRVTGTIALLLYALLYVGLLLS